MTTSRDPDALLAAYLADGMSVLSDRVIEAVLDEAHRTRQRVGFGPRRTLQMLKPFFAATAAIVAVVIGAYALGWLKPPIPEPGTSPVPSSVPSPSDVLPPTAQASTVGLRRTVLEPGSWRVNLADRLVIVDVPADIGPVYGELWPDGRTARFDSDLGNLTIQSGLWQTNREWCDPTANVFELPDTPDEIADWLHGMADADVTDLPDVTVDGGTAKSFDFVLRDGCYDSPEPPPGSVVPWQGQNEHVVIYAIPTDGQALLVMSYAVEESVRPTRAFRDYLDEFVRGLEFPS